MVRSFDPKRTKFIKNENRASNLQYINIFLKLKLKIQIKQYLQLFGTFLKLKKSGALSHIF